MDHADPAPDDDLRDLIAEVAELVAWEEEIGGVGLPLVAQHRSVVPAHPAGPHPDGAREGETRRSHGGLASPSAPALNAGGNTATDRLLALAEEAATCQRCRLGEGRTRSVFARGSGAAEIVFVGEGPGYHEDQQGLPFVGQAGQLLDRMIAAMGYSPDDVYICNVVKCRPPDNRTPLPEEAAACLPYLDAQIDAVQPRIIVALGRCAGQSMGLFDADARGWRGVMGRYRELPVMPTYHPAFLLRSPQMKRPVWEDLQRVLAYLGRKPRGAS